MDDWLAGTAAIHQPHLHFTNEEYARASSHILTLRQSIIDTLRGGETGSRNGQAARARLGHALHTIQDFYSHSNWVERGHPAIQTALGTSTLPNPPSSPGVCTGDPNSLDAGGGAYHSSSYFVGYTVDRDTFGCNVEQLPAGKCFHGNYRPTCTGINKDLDTVGASEEGVAKSPYHENAVILAREATRVFTQGIIDEIRDEPMALRALFNSRTQFVAMIDKTTSMSQEISNVKSLVSQMVQDVSSVPEEAPSSYMLQTYGDPDVDAPLSTNDPNQYLTYINNVSLSGGGTDCPELTNSGLLSAVSNADAGSTIYVFTDATAKDQNKLNDVIARAKEKNIRLAYTLTGSCSPTDPGYIRSANETGGMVMRVTPSQIPSLQDQITPESAGNRSTIVKLAAIAISGQAADIFMPVEAGMKDLTFSLSVPPNNVPANHQVTIFRPSGFPLLSDEDGVSIRQLGSNYYATIATPESGQWKATVSGYGPYTAEARGTSAISIDRFDFVEPNIDIHGGFFPMQGEPVSNSEPLGSARLLGNVESANFKLINESGELISSLALVRGAPSSDRDEYIGIVPLPIVPFRLAVSGTQIGGAPFARVFPAIYRGQLVEVLPTAANSVIVEPGENATIGFKVKNHGSAATFNLTATHGSDYPISLSAAQVAVGAGGSADVTVDMLAPEDARPLSVAPLVLTATKADAPTVFNTASVNVSVDGTPDYPELTNRVPAKQLSGQANQEITYQFTAPPGVTTVRFLAYGGSGDISLYAGKERIPTATANDGSSAGPGAWEKINFYSPSPGIYYLKVIGVTDFSRVSIMARYSH